MWGMALTVPIKRNPYGADQAQPGPPESGCSGTGDGPKGKHGLEPACGAPPSCWLSLGSSLTELSGVGSSREESGAARSAVGSGRKELDSRESSIGARERGGSVMMRITW